MTLVAIVKEAVQPLLPTDLRARSEERVLLETIEQQELASYRSDIAIIESGKLEAAPQVSGGAVVLDPVLVESTTRLKPIGSFRSSIRPPATESLLPSKCSALGTRVPDF